MKMKNIYYGPMLSLVLLAAGIVSSHATEIIFKEGAEITVDGVGTGEIYASTQDVFTDGNYANGSNQIVCAIGGARVGLMRFEDIFGQGVGQIPIGSSIQFASLQTVVTYGHGAVTNFGYMDPSQVWTEASKQGDFSNGNGIQYGADATLIGTFVNYAQNDVTSSLSVWSNDPALNNGWGFTSGGGNKCWRSSDNNVSAERPVLRVTFLAESDSDNDGVSDSADNCPAVANPLQENNDGDTLGDLCDSDDDNDGTNDVADNCPIVGNPDQADFDYDGLGDACDTTIDAGSIAQHVEDKVAYIVDIITALNVSGGNGMIAKLTGNGGVVKKMSSAISAYNGGYIDVATYLSELDGALGMLDAFDNQVAPKIAKGKIVDPDATAILDASDEINTTIDNLKVAAGG